MEAPLSPKTDPRDLERDELTALAVSLGQPAFRGKQLYRWLHHQGVRDFEAMSNLPAAFRERLQETAPIEPLVEDKRLKGKDGTVKCLFRLPSGRHIESVLIPDFDDDGAPRRMTVCVSSQVGCAMGCHFCATGLMGFQENLTAGQIIEQVQRMSAIADEEYQKSATNVVFMGMGEPLQNYERVRRAVNVLTDPDGLGLGAKRVTVSTVGLAKRIKKVADDQVEGRVAAFRLAVSLHAPTDEQRSAIMPVNRSEKTDLKALREALVYFGERTGQRITYEYCVFEGRNDHNLDAKHLAEVSRWTPSKVNLIVYNPVEGAAFRAPSEPDLHRFIRLLIREGVGVTVRRSRGQDIDAACGQLATREAG